MAFTCSTVRSASRSAALASSIRPASSSTKARTLWYVAESGSISPEDRSVDLSGSFSVPAGRAADYGWTYPLQGKNRIVHGKANAVLLPYVLDELSESLPEKFTQVAGFMGLDLAGTDPREAGHAVARFVSQLSIQTGVPTKMSILGVEGNQLEAFTEEAYNIRRLMDNCPVDLSEKQVSAIFERAL